LESSQFTHRPFFFFSSYPAHPQFSTLSLHDALPIYTTSVGISPWKLAGSFMSFHTPRTPISTKNFWFPAHHFLTSGFPKSGNTGSEEHTSELQSRFDLVCRLLLEKKNNKIYDKCTSI